MAMSTRAKWMSSVIADVFNVGEYDAHEVFKTNKDFFDTFWKGVGPARIFVYYQIPYKMNDNGDPPIDIGSVKEFVVSDGEKVKLRGKGVYFVRTTAPGKAINANGTNDSEILFGEISQHCVPAFDTIINSVYKPLIEKLEPNDWGVCDDEQKKEFNHIFDKFSGELREARRSLLGNVNLEPYEKSYEPEVKQVMQNGKSPSSEMISHFEKIFNEWSEIASDALQEADADRKEEKDAGPKQELDYWKARMRKLTGLSEKLRSKSCRTVYDVLTQASQNPTE